jgi:hypothetical protein
VYQDSRSLIKDYQDSVTVLPKFTLHPSHYFWKSSPRQTHGAHVTNAPWRPRGFEPISTQPQRSPWHLPACADFKPSNQFCHTLYFISAADPTPTELSNWYISYVLRQPPFLSWACCDGILHLQLHISLTGVTARCSTCQLPPHSKIRPYVYFTVAVL